MATSSNGSQVDIQRMINVFRVAELKEILKAVNASTGGRKKDLQSRAQHFVDSGNPKLLQCAEEVYQKHFGNQLFKRSPPKPPISHTSVNPPSFHVKHPDVKLKPHPFFRHIDSVIRTTALESPQSYMRKATTLQFHLTLQQIQQIFLSETSPGNYLTQVILRFCRRETSCEQEEFYPSNCFITINNQTCPIPGYNPIFSVRPEYKRQGKPINITSYIHTSPAVVNTLAITWNKDLIYPQGFCVSIDLMSSLSPTDLLHSLKSKGIRSPDVSRAMLREKLLVDKDSEIAATSLKLSLICPLGKTRIRHPCRSISCGHIQCFDASTYLQMNERKPKWICPVCDKHAAPQDLLIDGLLLEICETSSETDIEFSSDGSWHPTKKIKEDTYLLATPPTTTSSITITDSPGHSGQPFVIDLTIDSDDENDSPQSNYIRPVYNSSSKSDSSSIQSKLVFPRSHSQTNPHSLTTSKTDSQSTVTDSHSYAQSQSGMPYPETHSTNQLQLPASRFSIITSRQTSCPQQLIVSIPIVPYSQSSDIDSTNLSIRTDELRAILRTVSSERSEGNETSNTDDDRELDSSESSHLTLSRRRNRSHRYLPYDYTIASPVSSYTYSSPETFSRDSPDSIY